MSTPKIIIIGGGHMGLAITRGLVRANAPAEITVVDTDPDRRALLQEDSGFRTTDTLSLDDADLVVLAVPPQLFAEFAASARGKFQLNTPVLSVMAGLTAQFIAQELGTSQVVRSIPNTPSEVFYGMSVYYAPESVQGPTIAATQLLLSGIGQAVRVQAEELIDDATALCGGGPAFVSYIADSFCQFATSRGFTEQDALLMTTQVLRGTAELIAASGRPPMQLCQEVMTPQGTTERGIATFEEHQLKKSLAAALTASANRSRELAALSGAPAALRRTGG